MSEHIASLKGTEHIGELFGLEFKIDKLGRPIFYELDEAGKRRRLKQADILQSFGHEPEQKPEPSPAIWHNQDSDIPVTVLGVMGKTNGDIYFEVENSLNGIRSLTGIPASELEWLPDEKIKESAKPKPEVDRVTVTEDFNQPQWVIAPEEFSLDQDDKSKTLTNMPTETAQKQLLSYIEGLEQENSRLARENDYLKRQANKPNLSARWNSLKKTVSRHYYSLPAMLIPNRRIMVVDERGNVVREKREGSAWPIALLGAAAGAVAVWAYMKYQGSDIDMDSLQVQLEDLEQSNNQLQQQLEYNNDQLAVAGDQLDSLQDQMSEQALDFKNQLEQTEAELKQLIQTQQAIPNLPSSNAESNTAMQTFSLEYYGDTIWSDVSRQLTKELGYSPSDSQILKATRYVLDQNSLSWADARSLPVGFRYKMPTNLTQVI